MRLLDTRKINLSQWIKEKAEQGKFGKLDILTGFLYKRGWESITLEHEKLNIRTISSVKVDYSTKAILERDGHLPATNETVYDVRFINELTQHAKLFILSGSTNGTSDVAIIGSSNLTGPGLGIGVKKNLELNYVITDATDITQFHHTFAGLWDDAKPANQVQLIVDESQNIAPQETYFAQLAPGILTYSEVISNFLFDANKQLKDYSLAANEKYQVDAIEQIDFRLQRYGCCFLSDDVGLGKTIMGAGLLKRYIARYVWLNPTSEGIIAAIICPKPIESQWANHLGKIFLELEEENDSKLFDNLIKRIQIITYGQEGSNAWQDISVGLKTDLKLLIIDEAHRLRNTTNFYNWMSDIDSELRNAGSNPKYLFLTATPINNAFFDLYNLFRLALPPSYWQNIGIIDIKDHLKKLDSGFEETIQPEQQQAIQSLQTALGRLMIRRDVEFLRNEYGEEHLARLSIPEIEGKEQKIEAPNGQLAQHAEQIASYLKDSMFHPYRLSVAYEEMNSCRLGEIQTSVSSVLRAHLSKSIQSSLAAGISSLGNIIARCQEIMKTGKRSALGKLEEDFGQDANDKQISDDEICELNPIDDARLNEIKELAEIDIKLLKSFLNFLTEIQESCDQEKANALVAQLDSECPTLVFTEYRSTAKWLIKELKSRGVNVFPGGPDELDGNHRGYIDELLRLDPSDDSALKLEKPNYSVYVLTDKYSEGKNFHKCRILVNYDLPWNPIRKIQRQGRIVRVGSLHRSVRIRSLVYSHPGLNDYANPEKVLRDKLRKISSIFGKGVNRDILDEGDGFISYFVRYNKAALGSDSKSKSDAIGIIEAGNEGTYAYLVWDAIVRSGYQSQTKDLLTSWDQLRVKRHQTFLLKGVLNPFFAVVSSKDQNVSLQWFKLESGTIKPANLEDIFGIESAELSTIPKLEETEHQDHHLSAPDPTTAKLIRDIRQEAKNSKAKKAVMVELGELMNLFADITTQEHFRSVYSRLKANKNNKTECHQILTCFIDELRLKKRDIDGSWVVICTEGYLDLVRHKKVS